MPSWVAALYCPGSTLFCPGSIPAAECPGGVWQSGSSRAAHQHHVPREETCSWGTNTGQPCQVYHGVSIHSCTLSVLNLHYTLLPVPLSLLFLFSLPFSPFPSLPLLFRPSFPPLLPPPSPLSLSLFTFLFTLLPLPSSSLTLGEKAIDFLLKVGRWRFSLVLLKSEARVLLLRLLWGEAPVVESMDEIWERGTRENGKWKLYKQYVMLHLPYMVNTLISISVSTNL